MEDRKILQLYLSRSENAIVETEKKYGRYCLAIAFGILQNSSDADECVSDTYMTLWNSIPPQKPRNLRAFIARIARNASLTKYRALSAEKRGGNQVTLALDELSECIPLSKNKDLVSEEFELKDALNRFLSSLPRRERIIFLQRYWYASSVRQIAEEFRQSESAIAVNLFRTRKKLREFLEKEGVSL